MTLKLKDALKQLDDAAQAAIQAGGDTIEFPMLNRQKLRDIKRLTSEMVKAPMVAE